MVPLVEKQNKNKPKPKNPSRMEILSVWANLEVLSQWQSTEMPAEEADDFDPPLFS